MFEISLQGFIAIPKVQNQYGPGDDQKYAFQDGLGGGINDADYDVWGPAYSAYGRGPVCNGVVPYETPPAQTPAACRAHVLAQLVEDALAKKGWGMRVFHGFENAREIRTRPVACSDQVVAGQQPRRTQYLGRRFFKFGFRELVVREAPVAGRAIQPVQLQVFFKSRQTHKSLECCGAHLQDVLETQMVRHERFDLLGVLVRKTQVAADVFGHTRADKAVAAGYSVFIVGVSVGSDRQ